LRFFLGDIRDKNRLLRAFDGVDCAVHATLDLMITKGNIVYEKNMVKVGIIIPCRYNSNRLPGKILIKIAGKEVLSYIIERLSYVTSAQDIVVATSVEQDDDPIVDFCEKYKVKYFRGPKKDVSRRVVECAEENGFDYFVRICGDSIFVDYALLDEMISIALNGNYTFVSNVKGRTFPEGISVEILKTEFYKEIVSRFETVEQKEHVTLYLYNHESEIGNHFYLYNNICPEAKGVKLALDNTDDLTFISKIVEKMDRDHTRYLLKDIYNLSKDSFLEKK